VQQPFFFVTDIVITPAGPDVNTRTEVFVRRRTDTRLISLVCLRNVDASNHSAHFTIPYLVLG
jgi:hypothetical protein